MFFKAKPNLPKEITSYDVLKALAIITMIVDHLGYYFFPEEVGLRLIGRMSLPIWMFLVGYAKSRDLGLSIWVGAFLCMGAEILFGGEIFAVNILFSIILVRLVLDYTMRQMFDSPATIWIVPALLIMLAIPSWYIFEYGTVGLMVAMSGWLMRRRVNNPSFYKVSTPFFIVTVMSLMIVTTLLFGLNNTQSGVLAVLLSATFIPLYYFKRQIYSGLTGQLPAALTRAIQFMGRYSMEIYILHVILFFFLAQFVNSENFGFLQWSWF